MKILVIGSGGREHAVAWKFALSPQVDKVYVAPGNGGTAAEEKCENIPLPGEPAAGEVQDFLRDFAKKEKIGLVVVGPEAPLAEGIVDRFRQAGLSIVGADKKSALLETSKIHAKGFMKKYGVQTARSRHFSEYPAALHYTEKHFSGKNLSSPDLPCPEDEGPPKAGQAPLVIKADGLAAGKGVILANTQDEAAAALHSFMKEGTLGAAGKKVLLEEYLPGREVSVLAAVSVSPGKPGVILPFLAARDHKRRFDGGQGPNTGGMGAIAPVPDFSPGAQQDFTARILRPTLRGMEHEGLDYRGFIFFGLMVQGNRCSLLEYNVRLGDPETQAVLPLLESDLTELCLSLLRGTLGNFTPVWKNGAVCAPAAVSGGYPGAYRKGIPITIDRERLFQTGARLFVAGAVPGSPDSWAPGDASSRPGPAVSGAPLLSSGGRVFTVSAWGPDAKTARTRAYEALGTIHFEGMDYRTDIGAEL
jgi:phosphoribosylamine--glycine ligase